MAGQPDAAAREAVWREHGTPLVAGAPSGPLRGLRAAVKDLYAVRGHRVGAGNPAWLAEAAPEPEHAWAVQALLDAGADVAGIAQTDEFAYSLSGTNAHYGTPGNPAAPGRVTGGSSNGPAAAVAAGEADIGLGSDTAGSVRVPASYCGLYGMRPTHGVVPVTGMLPLAPEFDTVGWLARDAATLTAAGDALLPERGAADEPVRTAFVAPGLTGLAEEPAAEAFGDAAADLARAADLRTETVAAPDAGDAGRWAEAFTVVQGAQAWECDGAWVTAHPGALGPGVTERFARAAAVTRQQRTQGADVLDHASRALRRLLRPGSVLLLPATSGPAPPPHYGDDARKAATRKATVRLTCLASLAGLPCVTLPRMTVGGLPAGLCAVGPRGSDHTLLALARA